MRKIFCVILTLLMCVSLFGCKSVSTGKTAQGNQQKSVNDVLNEKINGTEQNNASGSGSASGKTSAPAGPVDIDLPTMSSTMVYAEVNQMITQPEDFLGKKVRMNGLFNYLEQNNTVYFSCIISDATACCAQGIEFDLKDQRKFPDEYPQMGEEITVSGIFTTYMEGNTRYCQLKDAVME